MNLESPQALEEYPRPQVDISYNSPNLDLVVPDLPKKKRKSRSRKRSKYNLTKGPTNALKRAQKWEEKRSVERITVEE